MSESDVLLNEANKLFLKKHYRDAVTIYEKILKLDSTNINAINNKGYALSKSKDYKDAIDCYNEGLRIKPNDKTLLINKISALRKMFATFENEKPQANIDEYSGTNIQFHQAILRLSKCELLNSMTETLFIHMRSIRNRTIGENNRASRAIIDHMNIIEALEQRDTELAEGLVRQHTLELAIHVEKHVNYLD